MAAGCYSLGFASSSYFVLYSVAPSAHLSHFCSGLSLPSCVFRAFFALAFAFSSCIYRIALHGWRFWLGLWVRVWEQGN